MSVMKIAGKNPSNEVQGVAVSATGDVFTEKVWKNEVVKIYEGSSAPTSGTKACTEVDLSDCGAVSLRVENGTDKEIKLGLYLDYKTNNYQMRDGNGALIRYSVPASTNYLVITPDDFPQLQWITKLRLYFILSENASEGAVNIWAVKKA